MEDDLVELRHPVGEAALEILVHEEARVLEPGAQHAVVTAHDHLGRAGRVHHRQVTGQEIAVFAAQREVALVTAHHLDGDLVRQREERRLERAREDVRLLDERRVLADQERVGHQHAARFHRRRLEPLDHGPLALGRVDQDVRPAESLHVAFGPLERDGLGREEAVTVGRALGFGAREAHRDDLLAVQAEEPVHRTPERDVALPPSHRLTEGDAPAELTQEIRQHLGRRLARLFAQTGHVGALVGLLDHQRLDRETELLGEADRRLLRRAVRLERRGLGRTEDLLGEIPPAAPRARRRSG